MVRVQRVIRCLFPARAGTSSTAVVIVHEPTQRFLGQGLVLTDRAGAVMFDSLDAARRFLDRYGSEPSLVAVGAEADGGGSVNAAA